MKHVLVFFLLFILFPASAQDNRGKMITADGDIYYQRVVECPGMSAADIKVLIKQSGVIGASFQNVLDTDSKLVINIEGVKSRVGDLEGYPVLSTDFIISRATEYRGRVIYDFKDGRYRVTCADIEWRVPETMFGEYSLIRDVIYNKRGELRNRYNEKLSFALAHTFDVVLCPSTAKHIDNDNNW